MIDTRLAPCLPTPAAFARHAADQIEARVESGEPLEIVEMMDLMRMLRLLAQRIEPPERVVRLQPALTLLNGGLS